MDELFKHSESSQVITPNMLLESNRLETFKNWPNPNISPSSLAKAGFYYLNKSDYVKCAWCCGVIAKWELQDNAFVEHQRFFPECPRVKDMGIQQLSAPKKPYMSSLEARLRTYENWPIVDIQKPLKLAQAGLYYQNVDDQVRCFHCNIGLRSWQKEDDAFEEHAKWSNGCEFIRLVKGNSFIHEVANHQNISQIDPPVTTSLSIEDVMDTIVVKQALEIGIEIGAIRNAIQQQLLTIGRPYETVDELVKAVFDIRTEAEIASESSEHSMPSEITDLLINTQCIVRNAVDASQMENTSSCRAVCATNECDTKQNTDILHMKLSSINAIPEKSSENTKCSIAKLNISLSLEEENRQLKDARLCKVCLDDEVGVVYLPCGHLVTCVQCAPTVNQCPMCRSVIKGFVRTYLS